MSEESLGTLTEQEIIEVQKELTKTTNELTLSENGEVEAQNIAQLSTAVAAYRKAGLIPKHLDTNAMAIGAIMFCKQIGVPPLIGIGQVACIHGKFSAYGSLFTALAQKDPDFGFDEIFYLDENQEVICAKNKNLNNPSWACIVRTQKKGSPFINEFSFTMNEAKEAGIIRNVWKTYPRSMLFWKAMARAYRATYPAALNGIMMAEDLKTDWEPKEVTESVNLNSL
jgi:hypothetical protein